jgi:hypothetical protein
MKFVPAMYFTLPPGVHILLDCRLQMALDLVQAMMMSLLCIEGMCTKCSNVCNKCLKCILKHCSVMQTWRMLYLGIIYASNFYSVCAELWRS